MFLNCPNLDGQDFVFILTCASAKRETDLELINQNQCLLSITSAKIDFFSCLWQMEKETETGEVDSIETTAEPGLCKVQV